MAYSGRAWQYSVINSKLEDALTIDDNAPLVEPSSLGPDQVIVQVIAASINPVDYKLCEAPLVGGILVPRPATPGLDLCGRIVAKHPSNTDFAEGQLVFGGLATAASARGMGTLRQYTVLSSKCLAPLPDGVDPDHAAAVGTAGTSAYQSLTPETLKPGAKVFINGGSGGVGTWTVQMAKAMGAQVVTTCSTDNVDLCQQLGADEVVDYRTVDVVDYLKQKGPEFDLLIDNVGKSTELYDVSSHVLKPGGTFVQVGVGSSVNIGTIASMAKRQLWPAFLGAPKFYFVNMDNNTKFLKPISDWVAEGKIKAVIDKTYSWEDVPEAYRHLREGHAKGKIVVKVEK